jgi:isocitrate dehydrogenase
VPGAGKLTITFVPDDGGAAKHIQHEVFQFKSSGVALAMYNTEESIRDFARSSMQYALERNMPLYMT